MKLIFTFSLLNSIGTVVMWLMLGPYYSQLTTGTLSMGLIGMVRQFSFIAGALVVGSWSDEGRPLVKHARIEVVQVALGSALLIPLWYSAATIPPSVFPIWSCLRFALGGATFVLGFKVMSSSTGTLGKGAILHLLTTQGASLFGALVSVLLPRLTNQPFQVALVIDVLTSALFILVLLVHRGTQFDVVLQSRSATLIQRVRESVTSFWEEQAFPANWIQFVALIGISGFAVSSFVISQDQHSMSAALVYPACSFVYGIALWAGGLVASKYGDSRIVGIVSAFLLLISGVLSTLKSSNDLLLFIQFFLYVSAFSGLLHYTNTLVLKRTPKEASGRMRSSMLFYLSVIFAISEAVFGHAFHNGLGNWLVGSVRMSASVVLVLGILSLNRLGPRMSVGALHD